MEKKKSEITFKKVFSNYSILSRLTYHYIKSESFTVEESSKKNKEFLRTTRNMKIFGGLGTLTPLAGLSYFCLKTKFFKTKVFFVFSYFMLSSHFYILGTNLGILSSLKTSIKNLYEIKADNLDKKIFDKYIDRVFIENKEFEIEDIYKETYKEDIMFNEIMENKYVKNDYFIRNSKKYLDDGENKNEFNLIPKENFKVKGPIIDCFLTRYIYCNVRKYIKKYKRLEN